MSAVRYSPYLRPSTHTMPSSLSARGNADSTSSNNSHTKSSRRSPPARGDDQDALDRRHPPSRNASTTPRQTTSDDRTTHHDDDDMDISGDEDARDVNDEDQFRGTQSDPETVDKVAASHSVQQDMDGTAIEPSLASDKAQEESSDLEQVQQASATPKPATRKQEEQREAPRQGDSHTLAAIVEFLDANQQAKEGPGHGHDSNGQAAFAPSLDRGRRPAHLQLASSNTAKMATSQNVAQPSREQGQPANNNRRMLIAPNGVFRNSKGGAEDRPTYVLGRERAQDGASVPRNLPPLAVALAASRQQRQSAIPAAAEEQRQRARQANANTNAKMAMPQMSSREVSARLQIPDNNAPDTARAAGASVMARTPSAGQKIQSSVTAGRAYHPPERRPAPPTEKRSGSTSFKLPASCAHQSAIQRWRCPAYNCSGKLKECNNQGKTGLMDCEFCSRVYWQPDDSVTMDQALCPIFACPGRCVVFNDPEHGSLHGCNQCRVVFFVDQSPSRKRMT